MIPHRIAKPLTVTGGAAGIASFMLLHVLLGHAVSPWREPVSSYAIHGQGGALFAAGALGFALGCAGVALARETSLEARLLSGGSGVMFVLVVVFPTDSGAALSSVSGQIHRYAAGAAFVGLTMLALRSRRRIPVLAWINVLTLAVTTLNTFLPGLADGEDWRGVPQRILLVAQALTLIALIGGFQRPVWLVDGWRPSQVGMRIRKHRHASNAG